MKTKFFLALAAALLVSAPAFAATKDAALDDRGAAVRATNGTCVRTKWDDSNDICAPKAPEPAPAPEVVAAPTPVVEKAPEPAPAPAPIKMAKELSKDETSVYFDFDKAVLSDKEKAQLDSVAKVLQSDKEVQSVKIVAYADKMGKTEYNDALSQKRAKAVNDYLNEKGYLKTTVAETAWLGESAPKTTCADSLKRAEKIECLKEDRRAEIVINYFNIVEVKPEAKAEEPKSGEVKAEVKAEAAAPAEAKKTEEAPAAESKPADSFKIPEINIPDFM